MKTKNYNSKLRALLSIRNFSKALENHYEQMMQIEKNLNELNKNASSIIAANCSTEAQLKWKNHQKELNNSLSSINEILKSGKEKVMAKNRSDSCALWTEFDTQLSKFQSTYKAAEKLGYDLLPVSEHKHWEKDVCNFEDAILPLIVSHAGACKTELTLIEKYTPKELDYITQIVISNIPDNFSFEEADKYEHEYLNALEEFKKEFKKEKNLWDKFLDILAGGTHQFLRTRHDAKMAGRRKT